MNRKIDSGCFKPTSTSTFKRRGSGSEAQLMINLMHYKWKYQIGSEAQEGSGLFSLPQKFDHVSEVSRWQGSFRSTIFSSLSTDSLYISVLLSIVALSSGPYLWTAFRSIFELFVSLLYNSGYWSLSKGKASLLDTFMGV